MDQSTSMGAKMHRAGHLTGAVGIIKGAALAAAVALFGAGAQQAQAENMADALVGAYNTSGLLEQNRALLRAADEDVAISVAALRPVLAWTASVTRSFSETKNQFFTTSRQATTHFVGLSLDLLVYDGGASKLGTQAAKETVLATRQTLLAIEQQILLRAIGAYMNVQLQGENVSLRQNNLRLLREELRAAQDRFEVGEVTRTDVALAQSRVAAARSNLADAHGALANAKAEYTNAVGHAPGALAGQPKLPKRPSSLEAAQALAVRNHPSVLAVQHQVSAAELNVQRVTKAMGPSASFRADLGYSETWGTEDSNMTGSLSLVLRQPIYQGGRLAANLRRAMAVRDSVRANLLSVQRNVVQDVNDAYVRLEVAGASLVAANERVRAARVAFNGIREEATLGARTTLDVLTAEQELLNAQTARISDQAERWIASYELLSSQGLLTAERLELGVQIYDPTIYYNLVKNGPANISRQSRDLNRVLEALGKK